MAKDNQVKDFENEEFFDGEMEEDIVVEMTDDEGNVYYYAEEMIIPVGDEKFAILVGIQNEEDEEGEHHCHCGCGDDDCDCDEDVIIAKIVLNADGEEEYIEPTDEEFEAVQEAYEQLMAEADED